MKIYWITLQETITTFGVVEIMAEDEPTARDMALHSPRVEWKDPDGDTFVYRVEELIDYDKLS